MGRYAYPHRDRTDAGLADAGLAERKWKAARMKGLLTGDCEL